MDFIQQMIAERYGDKKSKTKASPKRTESTNKKSLIDKLNYILEKADRVDNDKADTIRKLIFLLEKNGDINSFIEYVKSDSTPAKPKYKTVKVKTTGGWVSNHLIKVQ